MNPARPSIRYRWTILETNRYRWIYGGTRNKMSREELEAHLKPFQTEPSYLRMIYSDDPSGADSSFWQILDTVELVRFNPHLDADDKIVRADFWLLWMPGWYGDCKPHCCKCTEVLEPDTYIRHFRLEDDFLHLQTIDEQETQKMAEWERWQGIKENRADYYEELAALNRKAAKRIANEGD